MGPRVEKFKNDFLLVMVIIDLGEANKTARNAVGAKFVKLQ